MGKTTTASKTSAKRDDVYVEQPIVESVAAQEVEPQLNLEQQVTVRNIAGWTVGFARLLAIGDVTIPRKGFIRLTRNEIISQVQNNNKLFTGIDGMGGHATLQIDDAETLRELGFDNSERFSDAKVKELFDTSMNQEMFEERLKGYIRTRAEKYALMLSIIKQHLNDFSKIRFCENYTGFKMEKVEQDEKEAR